jgi:hypothetical protein
MFTSLGSTSEYDGTRSTSSKVRPSPKNFGDCGVLVAICEDKKKIKFPLSINSSI